MPKSQALKFGVLILTLSLALGLFAGCQKQQTVEVPPDNGNPMVGRVLAVFDEEGDPYDLIIFQNGNAVSTTSKTKAGGEHGVQGRWQATPETIFVVYEDGSREAFVYYDGTIRRQQYYPRRPVTTTANRYEYGWMVKNKRAGFIGVWYCQNAQDLHSKPKAKPAEYIMHLASDGSATRTDQPGVKGTWIVTNDGTAMISWPDGVKDAISALPDGYEMRTWTKDMKPDQNAGIKSFPVRRGAF